MKIGRLGMIGALAAVLALPAAAQTPHVTPAAPLPTNTSPTVPSKATTASPAVSTKSTAAPPVASTSSGMVDINSASAVDLDKLPGVGKSRADAIIKNRPYKGKDDLLSRHIIPSNVYNGIKGKIIARQG